MPKSKEEHNAYMRKYMLKRYRRRRAEAINALGGKCSKCNIKDNLQFHHTADKSFTIAIGSSYSEERFQEELKKCILLCENCHKKEHSMNHGTVNNKCKCDQCRQAWNSYHKELKRKRRRG